MVIYAIAKPRSWSSSFVSSSDPQRFMKPSQDNITRRPQQPEQPQQPQPQPQVQQPEQPQQPQQQPQQSRRDRFLAKLREQRLQRQQEQAPQQQPRDVQPPIQRAHSFIPPQGANAFRPNIRNTTPQAARQPIQRDHGYVPQVHPNAFRPQANTVNVHQAPPQFVRITSENQKEFKENATRQVMSELKEMNALSFGEGQISVEMENDNPFSLVITLAPNDGLYKDGEYKIAMTIPAKYPITKPSFQFTCPIFHPNVSTDGSICFSLISEGDSRLRIADYAHGMLWLLFYPNLYSRMNCDCPQNEKRFAVMVRQSILGGNVAGTIYKRSPRLPAESSGSSGSGKGKEEASSDYLRNENEEGAQWEWRLVGEEWIQVFEQDFDKVGALQAAAESNRIVDDSDYDDDDLFDQWF